MSDQELELEITNLIQELQKVSLDLENAISPYTIIVEENLKKQEEVSKPYSEKCILIQNKIKELVLIRAKSLKTGSGNITYRKGGIRRKWDLDALDKVCEESSVVKDNIWKYRTEDKFEPQVLIKVDTKGKSITEV